MQGDSESTEKLYWESQGNGLYEPSPDARGEVVDPTSLVGVDDMINLRELKDTRALLYTLRTRYGRTQIYTNISSIVVAINPYEDLKLCTEEIKERYSNGESKPHPYKTTNQAFQNMRPMNAKKQVFIISGESGAGKTETTKIILKYLAYLSQKNGSGSGRIDIDQRIVEANPIIEAFGNAKTLRNNNSSRFGKLIQVHFDANLQITGGAVKHFLLEISRVVQQIKGERNYHFFYQLCAANIENKMEKYGLGSAQDYNYVNCCVTVNPRHNAEAAAKQDGAEYKDTMAAMDKLQFTPALQERIMCTTAAILHMGNLKYSGDAYNAAIVDESKETLARVARLLAVSVDDLNTRLTKSRVTAGKETKLNGITVAKACLERDAFAKYLYEMMFDVILLQCNEAIQTQNTTKTLSILDIFGFECFDFNSFDQLLINYTNETLQRHFNLHIFEEEKSDYKAENLPFPTEYVDKCVPCIALVDQSIFRDILDLCLLAKEDEDTTFANKLTANRVRFAETGEPGRFIVPHYARDVAYSTNGFIRRARNKLHKDLEEIAGTSIQKMKDELRTSAAKIVHQPNILSRFQTDLKVLMAELQPPTQPHYVRCIKPNEDQQPKAFDPLLVKGQLEYSGILNVVQIRQSGYPVRIEHKFFYDRYKKLSENQTENDTIQRTGQSPNSSQGICGDFLGRLCRSDPLAGVAKFQTTRAGPLAASLYLVGKTKVWLRSDGHIWLQDRLDFLEQMEAQRRKLSACISDKNTDDMKVIIAQARDYLPRNDHKLQEAEALYTTLMEIVNRMARLLGEMKDQNTNLITPEFRNELDKTSASARSAALSENVNVYREFLERRKLLMDLEDKLKQELTEGNYERLRDVYDKAKNTCKNGALLSQALEKLTAMDSILDELKQAKATNNLVGVIKAIERSDKLQMSSSDLSLGRGWLREQLLKQLQEYKTPHDLVKQSNLDAARELLSIKDKYALIRDQSEVDGNIDKAFKLVEAMYSRMALRLRLQQATDSTNMAAIQQLLKELADMPQNERFLDDEVERAQKAYELYGKRLQQALSSCENAITKKDAKLLHNVLEEYKELLPLDRYNEGKNALDKILEVEMKLAMLLNKNDVDELEKLLENTQGILDSEHPDLVRAQQLLVNVKVTRSKIYAGMASKNLDDLSIAIEGANEAKLSGDVEVQKARKVYNDLKAINDKFGHALESLVFDQMREAFEIAVDSGISGDAYTRNVERYMEYVRQNDRAKETALLEGRAKVVQYRLRCELDKLRESIVELHKLTGDDFNQWNEKYVGTKLENSKDDFDKSFSEYTQAQALVKSLDSIVQELSECLQNGVVSTIEDIVANRLPKTDTGSLPPIKVIEDAKEYLAKVEDFRRRLQKAFDGKDIEALDLLFKEAKEELKQNEDSKDILTNDMRNRYDSWHHTNDHLAGLLRSEWTENPTDLEKFLQAVKNAQDMNFSSGTFVTALDDAQKFVTMQLQLASSRLRESDLDSAREYERQLLQAVEYAKILADDNLFGRQIGEAGLLLKLMSDAHQLQSAWQSRDLDSTPRFLHDTTEKLGGFYNSVPEVELVVKGAKEWHIEASAVQQDLIRLLGSERKQADLIRDAVEKAERVLSGNNPTYRDAISLNERLKKDISEIEATTDAADLARLLAETDLHPDVSAIRLAKKRQFQNANHQAKWEVMSKGGSVEEFTAFASELTTGPLHAAAALKMKSLQSWIVKLDEAREQTNIEAAYDQLMQPEFANWECEERTKTRSWAVSALLTPLKEKISQAKQDLRSDAPGDLGAATMVMLQDAVQRAHEFGSLDYTKRLSPAIAEGRILVDALSFRSRLAAALEKRDEGVLRDTMTNVEKSFESWQGIIEKNQDWLVPARVALHRINAAQDELKKAMAKDSVEILRIAIDTAKRGTGTAWPSGPPLKEDDPLLLAADTRLKELIAIREQARQQALRIEVKEEKAHTTSSAMGKVSKVFTKLNATKLGDLYKTLASQFQLEDEQTIAKSIPQHSFKLGDIIAKWQAVVPYLLKASPKHERSTRGAHAAMAALQELWYMDHTAWGNVKHDMRVGLVKETKDCGNTSVSMGLAKTYFDNNPGRGFVGFMNCGSGGVKYQLYAKGDNDVIITLGEFKPAQSENQAPALFKFLTCGPYMPKKDAVTAEDLHKSMAAENALAPWKNQKLIADYFQVEPEVFAFITGDLRNFFEAQQDVNDRKQMNNIVNAVFGEGEHRLAKPVSLLLYDGAEVPFLPHTYESYFIPQADEGRMELKATQTLYQQIKAVLPKTEALEVIISFGIGRSSTQFAQARAAGIVDELPPMDYQKGMDDPQVVFVGEDIVQDYLSKPVLLTNLIAAIKQCRMHNALPTIALKSGCLLALLDLSHPAHDMFKAALAANVKPKTSQMLTIKAGRPESNEIKPLVIKLPASVSELCSEAAILFRGSQGAKHIQFIRAIDVATTLDLTEVKSDLRDRTIHFVNIGENATSYVVPLRSEEKKVVWFEDLVECVSPEWRNKSPKAADQHVPGIPFAWIPDKWHLVKDRLGKAKHIKDNQKIRGTQGALTALKDMYYMTDGAWREHVHIGIIKSTFECGNSSVSMGLAVSYFANEALNKDKNRVVGFLNCGTGGIKFQLYTNLDQKGQDYRVALVAEFKPGETSFADLKVDVPGVEYKCKYPTPIEEVRRRIFKRLYDTPWSQSSWPMKVPLFGFITGPLRDQFERLTGSLQNAFREFVNQAFVAPRVEGEQVGDRPEIQVHPISDILSEGAPPSYFISGENEGQMELYALRRMYYQMKPGLDPLVAFGIGQGNSHVTVVSSQSDPAHSDYRRFSTVGHGLPGMKDKKVLNLGPSVVQGFKDPATEGKGTQLDNLIAVVEQSWKEKRQPMIALKSGCLLMLDEEKSLRAQFVDAPPLSEELDTHRTERVKQSTFAKLMDRTGSAVQKVERLLQTQNLKIAPVGDKRHERVLQWVLQTEKTPGFSWGKSFQLPDPEAVPGTKKPAENLTLLDLKVRIPITSSRLCAMAALAYGIPTTSFFRVFFDALGDANGGNVMKLLEWKGTVGEEELKMGQVVVSKDFLGRTKKYGQGCLYFSSEHDLSDGEPEAPRETVAVAIPNIFQAGQNPDEAVELFCRAQAIYTYNEEFVEQDFNQRYNWSNEQYQQLATWMAAAPDVGLRVMQPYQLSAVMKKKLVPPPDGPPNSLQPGKAVASLNLKLPIGQYAGTADNLFHAIAQQLQALRIRPRGAEDTHSGESVHMDVKYQWQKEGKEVKAEDEQSCWTAVVSVYSEITLNVVIAGAWEPRSFGKGLKHAWIFKRENDWAPLWLPRPVASGQGTPDEQDLLEKLHPYLQESGEGLSAFKVFGFFWRRIVAFRDGDPPLQDQVTAKMRGLVDSFLVSWLRSQTAAESVVLYDSTPQFHSLEQWRYFISELEKAMTFGDNQSYKEAVALAFRDSLIDRWRATDRSRWTPETCKDWAKAFGAFYFLLFRTLTPDHYKEFGIASEKEEILRELGEETGAEAETEAEPSVRIHT